MKVEPKHDFTAKLRQENLLPHVLNYVEWQKAVRRTQAKGEEIPPMPDIALTSINLDLTTACNYRCDHCIDFDILNSKQRYAHENLLSSLQNMIERGLRSVILIGGGEPTLYPGFGEVVRFLKKSDIQVAIVSNGSRNERIREIADVLTERDWVRLSLDSGTDATFQKMHKPLKPVILEDICSWVPRIRERNPRLQVGFSFIIVWQGAERAGNVKIVENINEIVSATRLAQRHGFNYISLKPYLTRQPSGAEVMDPSVMANFDDTMSKINSAVKEAKSLETENFKVIESTNLQVLMANTWREFTKQPRTCHMTAFRQVVSPLGTYHCPTHRGIPKARIGDTGVRDVSSAGVTTKEQVAKIIGKFDASRECSEITCLYNSANWWIEDMINGNVDSVPLPDRGDYYL